MARFKIDTASNMIRALLGSQAVEWEPVNTESDIRGLRDDQVVAYGYTVCGERITAYAGSAKSYLANCGR